MSKRLVAGVAVLVVAAGVGGWFSGRSSVHTAKVAAAPDWLRHPFELEPPAPLIEPATTPWDPSKPDVHWILAGTAHGGRQLIVIPDMNEEDSGPCDQYEGRVRVSRRRPRLVVEVKAMQRGQCSALLNVYGLPMALAVPGSVGGRTVTGKGLVEPPPPNPWLTRSNGFGQIPNVVGLSFFQARSLLLRTGRPVLPTDPGQGNQDLVVTKQDPPGNAIVPRSDRSPIVMTVDLP